MSEVNTRKHHKRLPIHNVNGTVAVPLANTNEPAILDAADYRMLEREGLGHSWTFNPNGSGMCYVKASTMKLPGHLVAVARLIIGAKAGQVVSYRDGNRLNLPRSNLYIREGKAKRCSLEAVRAAGG